MGPAEGLQAVLASRMAGGLHPGPGPAGKGDGVGGRARPQEGAQGATGALCGV